LLRKKKWLDFLEGTTKSELTKETNLPALLVLFKIKGSSALDKLIMLSLKVPSSSEIVIILKKNFRVSP
jgi:hypothetical protein